MTASAPFWSGRPAPKNVLVIVTRRIGDVLLATPLIESLRQAWPDVAIDVLVFAGTEAILAANPAVRRIHTIAARPGWLAHLRFLKRIARRYELALSLVPGDRPTFYAFVAGRTRVGLLLDARKERWKRALLHRWVRFDPYNTHTIRMHLALAECLGIALHADPVVTWSEADAGQAKALLGTAGAAYAVLHPYPKFNYKMWTLEGWLALAAWLSARGMRVVLTGGNDEHEVTYVAELAQRMPRDTVNAAGRLTLGASAYLVSQAQVYIGPDTALTHVAAALGVPTIALYGPTDPVKWGPWPRGQAAHANPWRRHGSQQRGNVTLLQGVAACAPCLNEGCGRDIMSFSECLQQIPPSKVITAVQLALASALAIETASAG